MSMVCTGHVFIGDNDKEGIGQWLSWQFNNSFAGGVVVDQKMAAKASNVIDTLPWE